ncbi:MAG: phosphate ABC transporter permease subunit PstC [Spirochaetales bacterium]|jgi:phosphate transport system permease protein|nr:phosphate ABC transporter permease subunit PstC [Spirochaetales bacterium]
MAINRKGADIFFKHLFRVMSLTSVLALASILIFVFIQGAGPFIFSTASGIRIVPERMREITVNGNVYRNHTTFIDIPPESDRILVSFSNPGISGSLEIAVNNAEKDPEKKLTFSKNENGEITYPRAYTYTISYPGDLPGVTSKIHILLPEKPGNFFYFITGLEWRPTYNKVYGILPMILGTIMVSFGAILLGLPLAILSGVFLAEFIPLKTASLIRSGIELLAGIPSVVYGFFGLMVIVPWVKNTFHAPSGNGLLAAAMVLGVMILPTIITITEASLRAFPDSIREASLSLGASKMQTAWAVALPHAKSGVIAAVILGISRAVGETMAVILVAGNSPQLIRGLTDSIRTLTATIALEMGYAEGRHNEMLFSIGVVLFVLILALNSLILRYTRSDREEAKAPLTVKRKTEEK